KAEEQPIRCPDRASHVPPELGCAARVRLHPGGLPFEVLYAGSRQLDESLEEIRHCSPAPGGEPETFELDVTLPVKAGVEEVNPEQVTLAVLPPFPVERGRRGRFDTVAVSGRVGDGMGKPARYERVGREWLVRHEANDGPVLAGRMDHSGLLSRPP